MKYLLFVLLFSQNIHAACKLQGKFEVTGDWTSFDAWSFEFKNNELISSHTDDITNDQDWPTTYEIQNDSYVKLHQTTYASDGIIDVVLHLKIRECSEKQLILEPMSGYEVYFDETSNIEDAYSVFATKNLILMQ